MILFDPHNTSEIGRESIIVPGMKSEIFEGHTDRRFSGSKFPKSWAIPFLLSLNLDQKAVTVCGLCSLGGQHDQKDKTVINEVFN